MDATELTGGAGGLPPSTAGGPVYGKPVDSQVIPRASRKGSNDGMPVGQHQKQFCPGRKQGVRRGLVAFLSRLPCRAGTLHRPASKHCPQACVGLQSCAFASKFMPTDLHLHSGQHHHHNALRKPTAHCPAFPGMPQALGTLNHHSSSAGITALIFSCMMFGPPAAPWGTST